MGAEVAVPLVGLALAGAWFVRKRIRRQEDSAKKQGHAQGSFLQVPDQDLDAHYSAM